jgi:hypothetical protein
MSPPPSPPGRARRDALPEAAIDADVMGAVFHQLIPPHDRRRGAIAACQVGAIRRGAGYRHAVDYRLRLTDPVTGQTLTRLVTGVCYGPGRTRRLWESLRTADVLPKAGPDPAPFPPFAYIPDLDMLVQAFPYDHRLPALAELMAGPPAELAPPLLAEFGAAGWRIDEWRAESIRYRVDSRATLRVTLRARHATSGRTDSQRVYAKVYRDDADARQAHDAQRQLHDRLAAPAAPFRVAMPIAYVARLRTLVQREVPGEPLLHRLLRDDDVLPAIRMAARATAGLHRLEIDLHRAKASARPRSPRTRIERLRSIEERMRSARPDLARDVDDVVSAITDGLAHAPTAPTHGDLKPEHFLIDGTEIALLDFDLLSASDPVVDVVTMEAHLAKERAKAPGGRADAPTAARVFVEEYLAHAPRDAAARLPLHRAMASLVGAARTRRTDGPPWQDRVEQGVREAHRALTGRERD